MDTNINRVYVNPNFHRVSNRAIYTSDPSYSNNHLYVNPNFGRNASDVQQFSNLNRKIYVNPNFIKSTSSLEKKENSENAYEVYPNKSTEYSSTTINKYDNSNKCRVENSNITENMSPCPTSKSRYHLIRRNNITVLGTQQQVKESHTIKINKYKSIPLNNFKNNLLTVKNETRKQISSKCNTNILTPRNVNRNCFKLVRHQFKPTMNTSLKLVSKAHSLKIKRDNDLKLQLKLKVSNGIRKKNNIPCRLFTKYGKCLRNAYGTCKYVHDKKHVSLCRKFIKGICHDKQCLLSHELSCKKLPTCYFYLKGMCTKQDCPYLHVKLSEKTKVCHDFLKGYCDKGDTCLNRHVRQESDKNNLKRYTSNTHKRSRNIKLNNNRSKSIKTKELRRLPETKNVESKLENSCHNEQVPNDRECRYFKDLQNKEPMCEVLMPSRCKLGTLPSFIRL